MYKAIESMPAIMKDVGFKWSQGQNAGLPGSNANWMFSAEFEGPEAVAAWMAPSPAHKQIQELLNGLVEKASVIHLDT